MEKCMNPAFPLDTAPFARFQVNRKFKMTESDPELIVRDKVSIERLTETHVRLKWKDPQGVKSVVEIDLKASTARLAGHYFGNPDWARAGTMAVVKRCLLYLHHEQ